MTKAKEWQIDFIDENDNLIERQRAESYKEINDTLKGNTELLDVKIRALHKVEGETNKKENKWNLKTLKQ